MNKIRGLSSAQSGMVLSAGQLSDSLTTPLVGQISDKIETSIGKRIPLQLFGTIVVLMCYLPLFDVPFDVAGTVHGFNPTWDENWTRTAVYCFCASSMNVGWASVQVAHLALIPQITLVDEQRVKLTGQRQSFSQISTIVVLVVAFCLFQVVEESYTAFQQLVLTCVAVVGFGTSLIFVCTVHEVSLTAYANDNKERQKQHMVAIGAVAESDTTRLVSTKESQAEKQVMWYAWFKFPIFQVQGILYSCGRVALNVSMTLTPYFINQVLGYSVDSSKPINQQIAVIPSVTQAFSTIAGSLQPQLCSKFSIQKIFVQNTICGIISFQCMWCVGSNPQQRDLCQVIQAFIGFFTSILLTGATALINNVIGEQSSSAGVVYSVQSIFEKLANGYLIVTISSNLDGGSVEYINNVNAIIPASCLIISVVLVSINLPYPKFEKQDLYVKENLNDMDHNVHLTNNTTKGNETKNFNGNSVDVTKMNEKVIK